LATKSPSRIIFNSETKWLSTIEGARPKAYRAAQPTKTRPKTAETSKEQGRMKLKDQVAVVTGAGRNIGEEIAKLFAAEGAKVAVVDLDKERGERVANAIKAAGGDATLFAADVSKGSDVAALVKAIVARYGRIDVLVNNVAISDNKHIFDISEEEWDRVLAVTLKSQFLMGQQVGKQMAAQGGGRIVNIGSTSGFTGRSRAVAYSAAKGGVANLTRAMAAQLAPHKIRVNAIVPNKIGSPVGKDEFDPSRPVPNMAKRAGEPAEAAKAVLFLVSDDSSFVWGANLFVDGGVSAMDLS
jgi:NAD(P)-dependent dehydrogenase (short-subunit alcohol dehydrogenase family)